MLAISQYMSMQLDKCHYCLIIWTVLTWLSSDDANLAKLKSKIEPVISHHQVVVQLAPVFMVHSEKNTTSKDGFWGIDRPELAKLEAAQQGELLKLLRNFIKVLNSGKFHLMCFFGA